MTFKTRLIGDRQPCLAEEAKRTVENLKQKPDGRRPLCKRSLQAGLLSHWTCSLLGAT